MYRYIALLTSQIANAAGRLERSLRSSGLRQAASLDGIQIFADAHTPVLELPSGGALIGHAFLGNRRLSADDESLSHDVGKHLSPHRFMARYWGEYLLVQPGQNGSGAITIARDPSGGVDCVYSLEGGFITSDISLATQLGLFTRSVDWDFIRNNLLYPHLKTGRTGFVGLHELLPGCQLEVRKDRGTVTPTWNPWEFVTPRHRIQDRHEAQAEVRRAVSTAVNCWAETDASLLLELSGGLDSSIVAACLKGANATLACCNLVTPVPGADERQYAGPMADMMGVDMHVRTLGFEHPHFDSPPPPHTVAPSTWFLQHAANELKEAVADQLGVDSFFSGGGGDTVFCYTRTAAPAVDAFKEHGFRAGLRAVHDLAELHQCTVWKAGRLALKKLRAPPKPPRRPDASFLSPMPTQANPTPHPWFAAPDAALPGDRERVFDLAGTQVFRDGLARSTRRHLRMPLLSQPVVEACLRVPSWMWIAGGRNRAVARDAFADLLPPDVLHRRSKGTFMGYSGAVFRKNRRQLKDYLLTGELESRALLDTDALVALFDGDESAHGDAFMRIFDLCAIESWVRHQA